jgi:hypothetical protein
MRVRGFPTSGSASYRDSRCRPFLEPRLAVGHGMDFPLLGPPRAFEDGVALCHGAGSTLRHRHS